LDLQERILMEAGEALLLQPWAIHSSNLMDLVAL
jgi:hypothetical protein